MCRFFSCFKGKVQIEPVDWYEPPRRAIPSGEVIRVEFTVPNPFNPQETIVISDFIKKPQPAVVPEAEPEKEALPPKPMKLGDAPIAFRRGRDLGTL